MVLNIHVSQHEKHDSLLQIKLSSSVVHVSHTELHLIIMLFTGYSDDYCLTLIVCSVKYSYVAHSDVFKCVDIQFTVRKVKNNKSSHK